MKHPKLRITPKDKTPEERTSAKLMSDFLNWEMEKIINSSLRELYYQAVLAPNLSEQLFGYIDPTFVSEKQNLFLQAYEESLQERNETREQKETT